MKGFKKTAYINPELMDKITNVVSVFTGYSVDEMKSKSRKRPLCEARQMAIYFARVDYGMGLTYASYYFGGRDHSTGNNAIETIQDLCLTDRAFRNKVNNLRFLISEI